jgi:FkbM family methyltransferase
MSLSPANDLGYLTGTAEPHLQTAIRKYVCSGETVFDIGANMGYVSLSLARQVGPRGHVAAFEPIPRNLALLRQNLSHNQLSNVEVFDLAASDENGEALIRIAENFSTASMFWHRHDQSAVELVIKTVVIDELVDAGSLSLPRFIKIDVEGAEGLVVRGIRRTLARSNPILFIECSDAGREITWQLLRDLHYRCQSAITGKWIETFDLYRHSDFLWFPNRLGS